MAQDPATGSDEAGVPDLVTIGRVTKPHGIRGEVAVDVLSDVPGRFDAGQRVQLGGRSVLIETSRPHQGRMLVRFERVGDRSAAELLRGSIIEAPPADLSETETYYVHELVGMVVLGPDGADLGHVSSVIELPPAAGYDLLEVARADGTTWLLPAVDDFVEVTEDDRGAQQLQLTDPPEGLLDESLAAVVRPEDPSDPPPTPEPPAGTQG